MLNPTIGSTLASSTYSSSYPLPADGFTYFISSIPLPPEFSLPRSCHSLLVSTPLITDKQGFLSTRTHFLQCALDTLFLHYSQSLPTGIFLSHFLHLGLSEVPGLPPLEPLAS